MSCDKNRNTATEIQLNLELIKTGHGTHIFVYDIIILLLKIAFHRISGPGITMSP